MSALLALLKQKQQDMSASRRSRTAKIPDGSSRWRFMPSWRGEGQQFWHDFGQHFVKDSTGKIAAIYMCTDKTFGKPCAVCDAVSTGVKGATDDATLKILSDAKSSARVLLNAMHLDGPEPHKVQIAELPPTVFEQFVAICAEWEEAGESVLGATGKDIIITRNGTGKNTKYSVQVAAKATVVPADVCKKLNDLDEYVAQESSEAQNRALNSVRALSGLLPAPSSAGALPGAARGATTIEADDPYAVATPPRRAAAPVAADITDVPDLSVKPAVAAAPKAVPAAPAAVPVAASMSSGDDDLDDLIASLG